MPYSKEHKRRTREQILRAASHAFRAEGVGAVAIPKLMGQVGLTHGGFYAHFESKDALVAEACAAAFGEGGENLLTKVAEGAPGDELRAIIRAYLSRSHRDTPEVGCALPSLAAEIAREPAPVRHAFTQAVSGYLQQLGAYMPTSPADADAPDDASHDAIGDDALVLLSGMAGALLLARAVDDPALSDRILRTSRAFYTRTFAEKGGEAEAGKTT
jgi:TetR/AcrR family transcriptional repressor of nem operon